MQQSSRCISHYQHRPNDAFYAKLERIRLTQATKFLPKRTATELLNASKGLFVKTPTLLNPSVKQFSTSSIDYLSLFSLSDQNTSDSVYSSSTEEETAGSPSPISVIERNARIIKWLYQLQQMNS